MSPDAETAVSAVLARAFGRPGTIRHVRPLAGGWTNAVFAVDRDGEALIVRLARPDEPAPLGIDRARERRMLDLAATAGLSPAPLHVDETRGELVLPDAGAPTLSDAVLDVATLREVGRRIAHLHALSPPDGTPFDSLTYARAHLERARTAGVQVPEAIRRADADLRLPPGPRGLAHNDLNPDNILVGGRVWLVDWELAAAGDLRLDLLTLVETAGLAPDLEAVLFEAAGVAAPDAPTRTMLLRIHALRQYAWALARRALGRAGPEVRAQERAAAAQLGHTGVD